VDGIALGKMDSWQQVELEPGYRSDVLVTTNQPGTYYLVDNSVLVTTTTRDPQTGLYSTTTQSSDSLTCPSQPEQPNFLATVVVTGSMPSMPLPTAAELAPLAPFKPLITLNAKEPVTSEAFLSPTVTVDGFQVVDFTVAVHSSNVGFLASDHPFSHDRVRQLKLGNTEEWILNTRQDSLYYAHPFHIHVNPFQTWRVGPDGTPETVWRDTILVRQGVPVYFFTRYTDYIGTFVYHCHILDHEDQGMMELLEVVQDPM
jgi:FtsP/CotA-like multicopper oxidase with cupredoxin domain